MAVAQSSRIILKPFGYNLLRPLLANTDPERAHRQTITLLKSVSQNHSLCATASRIYRNRVPELPIELFGKQLKNPVGLAAGFDKDGVAFPALAALGFGFVELGTVTPEPQPGNAGKRIFRLEKEQSIINRLGFNSRGLDAFTKNLVGYPENSRPAMLGVNIGKNTNTPIENAIGDYEICLEKVYQFADYVVLNLSSPNSPGVRLLQQRTELSQLLNSIMRKRTEFSDLYGGRSVPVVLKISPDLNPDQVISIAELALECKVDALIATNTTIARDRPVTSKHYSETGGLSGKLLKDQSTSIIRQLAEVTQGTVSIIGVGGVSSANDAWEKLLAGATAVQLYTGMVFQGPAIVRNIVSGLSDLAKTYDSEDFMSALENARRHRY